MIRECTPDEVAKFSGLGARFYETLGLPGTFNHSSFIGTWTAMLATGAGMILGRFTVDGPVEAIGCALYPDVYTGEPTAATAFWFRMATSNGLGIGLLNAYLQQYCRDRGIKHLFVSALCNDRFSKVSDFLSAQGYSLAEMTYRKAL